MFPTENRTRYLVQAALIAALYAALTLAFEPFSYGLMQVRVSEALCVLVLFTSSAVPGLFVGCFVANFIGVCLGQSIPLDVFAGSLTTLLAAYMGYRMRRNPWLVPLPAVALNAIVVGLMLYYVFLPGSGMEVSLLFCALSVGAGQFIACYVLGMPLYFALRKSRLAERASVV